jgi:hypothetical protein
MQHLSSAPSQDRVPRPSRSAQPKIQPKIQPAKALLVTAWAETIRIQLGYNALAGFSQPPAQPPAQQVTRFFSAIFLARITLVAIYHLAVFCPLISLPQFAILSRLTFPT